MAKTATPCIDVCKFRRDGAAGKHCIGCSMTEAQKKISKKQKKPREAAAFVALVVAQQNVMGGYTHWRDAFVKRCVKKGRPVPDCVGGPASKG
ncbi:DUF1289 domain-containing protein [Palleronia sp. LCG004]|uniref:DUF1289 domain-containing protein n=1 Tax=Palleronia sp. LCG004 TaxID=3079304 RepID=UPI0029428A39|nr:DUF1289 domain-containing protein [Palleronia sp. LCG004]WOI56693.1 DUF1289 domain-containing protein [Palleronia sp. LCG004]